MSQKHSSQKPSISFSTTSPQRGHSGHWQHPGPPAGSRPQNSHGGSGSFHGANGCSAAPGGKLQPPLAITSFPSLASPTLATRRSERKEKITDRQFALPLTLTPEETQRQCRLAYLCWHSRCRPISFGQRNGLHIETPPNNPTEHQTRARPGLRVFFQSTC